MKSAALDHLWSISQWCASSTNKSTRLSGSILDLLAVPCRAPILLAAVIICIAEQYDGGRDDMMRVAKQVSEIVDPI